MRENQRDQVAMEAAGRRAVHDWDDPAIRKFTCSSTDRELALNFRRLGLAPRLQNKHAESLAPYQRAIDNHSNIIREAGSARAETDLVSTPRSPTQGIRIEN